MDDRHIGNDIDVFDKGPVGRVYCFAISLVRYTQNRIQITSSLERIQQVQQRLIRLFAHDIVNVAQCIFRQLGRVGTAPYASS